LDYLVDSFPHITNLASTWLKNVFYSNFRHSQFSHQQTSFLSLYGDYVENINHAETTLRRVWDENSKLRNSMVAYYKEFRASHQHAMTSSGGLDLSMNSTSSPNEKVAMGFLGASAVSSGAGSGSSGASSSAGAGGGGDGVERDGGQSKRSKNQSKDDLAGEALEHLVRYLRLPITRMQYYTAIFSVCLR
jgi:hypothetical protein